MLKYISKDNLITKEPEQFLFIDKLIKEEDISELK
jgi:hypothetical protein